MLLIAPYFTRLTTHYILNNPENIGVFGGCKTG
nr:MAG TPA: hypothetical protein [Caudoviricetes sp.]